MFMVESVRLPVDVEIGDAGIAEAGGIAGDQEQIVIVSEAREKRRRSKP